MNVHVRRAVDADRGALLALWERSVRATHHFLTDVDVVSLRPQVAAELAGDAAEWWVAQDDAGAVLGFVGYSPGTVEGLFLDPAHRGRGVGRRLVAHAQRLGGGPLRVDVNEQNGDARAFYERLGFAVVSRSATDGAGRPFPLLHMRRPQGGRGVEPAYEIALARAADVAVLPDIELAAARLLAPYAPPEVLATTTSLDDLGAAQAAGRLWVARIDGAPVGFAHVTLRERGVAHLAELDVHPAHGRRGVGRRLVAAVCGWAARAGYEAVSLTTFRDVPFNMPFYRSLGFEPLGDDGIGPALASMLEAEARAGLARERRVAMRWRASEQAS